MILSYSIPQAEGTMSDHYTLWGAVGDMALLAGLRFLSGIASLVISYEKATIRPEFQFDLNHPNGEPKSREELELEALEEPFAPWIRRFVFRPAFFCECCALLTQLLAVVKCLARMNQEIGVFQDEKPRHPLFWIAMSLRACIYPAVRMGTN